MPFVLFCGLPASGKTKRAEELKTYITEKYPDRNVNIVSDHNFGVNRNKVYAGILKTFPNMFGLVTFTVNNINTNEFNFTNLTFIRN